MTPSAERMGRTWPLPAFLSDCTYSFTPGPGTPGTLYPITEAKGI